MRVDARNLLARLGKSDFAYREFADRFSDLEMWPLFEALLKDARLFAAMHEEAEPPADAVGADADDPSAEPFAAAFARYDGAAASRPRTPQPEFDVRAMLRRLSEGKGAV